MRKTLLATTVLAFAGAVAIGSASAADKPKKLEVGLGGYMQQWIGMSSLDGAADDGGVSQYSDSEFYVRGSLTADNGLKFSVKFELEGNTHPDVIDESQATVSGEFGSVTLGTEDDPAALMHYGVKDVGVGLACGDPSFIAGITSCARSNGKGLGTSGWIVGGDKNKIAYYTPRMEGMQLGLSYSPESVEDGGGAPLNNDNDAWAVGVNYKTEMGDTSVGISLGHYQKSQTGAATMLMSGDNEAKMERQDVTAATKAIAAYNAGRDLMKDGKAKTVVAGDMTAAIKATNDLAAASDITASQADSQTFSNFGLHVGMGSFAFSVAYAAHDGGTYKVANMDRVVNANADGGSPVYTFDKDGDPKTAADNETVESADVNDPANDIARTVLVKDTARDYEVMGAGVMYSDGPMALSLSHMVADADDGSSSSATMLSMSYQLAPGIASRSTLMAGEQDAVQGTAFVTGITLSF